MQNQETVKLTRLDILCKLHNKQGGTIWQYNYQYGTDFLSLSETMFEVMILAIKIQKRGQDDNL